MKELSSNLPNFVANFVVKASRWYTPYQRAKRSKW